MTQPNTSFDADRSAPAADPASIPHQVSPYGEATGDDKPSRYIENWADRPPTDRDLVILLASGGAIALTVIGSAGYALFRLGARLHS